jgi:hypothetical protein
MIRIKNNETVIRSGTDTTIAIDVEVCAYETPLTMKTVSLNVTDTTDETEDHEVPDWDNSTKLKSKTKQWLIPTNKQTDTFPTAPRVENTAYDILIWEWRELYRKDTDIIRIESELREEFKSKDGVVSS